MYISYPFIRKKIRKESHRQKVTMVFQGFIYRFILTAAKLYQYYLF